MLGQQPTLEQMLEIGLRMMKDYGIEGPLVPYPSP